MAIFAGGRMKGLIVEKSGLSRRGIEWNTEQLKKKGLLKRVGPDKGGYWEVLK
jgi:ATP-dependent DNA helicase RecG